MNSITTLDEQQLANLATLANTEHRECMLAGQSALEHGRRSGEALNHAKAQCSHGTWGSWLKDNFEGSHQTANVYMQVFRRWDEIEANSQHAGNSSIRGALQMLAGPPETPTKSNKSKPFITPFKDRQRQAAKRLYIEAAIGRILEWAAVKGAEAEHKFTHWLCPAEGWMDRDRARSMILPLWQNDVTGWPDDTRQSEHDLLTELVCYLVRIQPLEDGGFPIVCMCDLAIGIHKFAGNKEPDEEPHRVAPCENYSDACVFSYCHSEADRQYSADVAEDWLANGPPPDIFAAIFPAVDGVVA
jgi:hypothetical protein